MNILKSLIAAIKATTDSPGKVDSAAKVEHTKRAIIASPKRGGKSLLQCQELVDCCNLHGITKIEVVRAGDSEKLKAAADALRQIECMTANEPTLDKVDTKVINRIALNGWRKTQEEAK